MGYRLHSAIKYEVKYNDYGRFNWSANYINRLIEILSEGNCWSNNNDYEDIGNADTLEADREILLENIDKIITPDNHWEGQFELNELFEDMENDKEFEFDKQYIHKELKSLIEQSDNNNNLVHFAWF